MQTQFITQIELAIRWSMNENTLRYWRWNGRGPKYIKIGRRVLYRLDDIEQFEQKRIWQNTSQYHTVDHNLNFKKEGEI
jgi:hypothetical protein